MPLQRFLEMLAKKDFRICCVTFLVFFFFLLCWVFIAAWVFLQLWLVRTTLQLRYVGFLLRWLLFLWSTGSRMHGLSSIVVVDGLSCPVACGIFPDQGQNLCLLCWQADSLPLSHQGNPFCSLPTSLAAFSHSSTKISLHLSNLQILKYPRDYP